MARLMPRTLRRSIVVGALLLMGVLMSAPAVGAIPANGPILPPPPQLPAPPPAHLPDLVVESINYGYAGRYLGYYIDAKVRNQSNHDVFSSFYVRDDSSWNKTVRVNGLAAGSFVYVRFYRNTCESRGTVVADAFHQVPEYNEYNNARFWVLIC